MFLPFADIYDIAIFDISDFSVKYQLACYIHKRPNHIQVGMNLVTDIIPCMDRDVLAKELIPTLRRKIIDNFKRAPSIIQNHWLRALYFCS